MMDAAKFDRAWKALSGMWYRQDKGSNTGRNSDATARAGSVWWGRLQEAYYGMESPTAKQSSRYGYAERRVKLGKADAESFKATCVARGEW